MESQPSSSSLPPPPVRLPARGNECRLEPGAAYELVQVRRSFFQACETATHFTTSNEFNIRDCHKTSYGLKREVIETQKAKLKTQVWQHFIVKKGTVKNGNVTAAGAAAKYWKFF